MLTILEGAKRAVQDEVAQVIIELFAENSPILQFLPFDTIQGGGLKYDLEESLPGIGFRGINEGYEPSIGVINPQFEPLVIAGGELDVDNHVIRTQGSQRRGSETARKVKALALKWTQAWFKGDSLSNPRTFDGIQARLNVAGPQVIPAGNTSGGDVVSLVKIDELVDAVVGPNKVLLMNKTMARRFAQAARDQNVGGYVVFEPNEFGQRIMFWGGDVPILKIEKDNENEEILAFDEVGSGGGAAQTTSIYCASMSQETCHGIQSGDIIVDDLGDIKVLPLQRTRVEWDNGWVIRHPEGAARLYGCLDAPFVK